MGIQKEREGWAAIVGTEQATRMLSYDDLVTRPKRLEDASKLLPALVQASNPPVTTAQIGQVHLIQDQIPTACSGRISPLHGNDVCGQSVQ